MKYAVQFVEPGLFGGTDVTVDTKAITFDEAMEIYNKCRKRFVEAFNNKQDAQLVVWEDVGDGEFPNYHKELVDLDTGDDLRYIRDTFYKTKLELMAEPT